MQNSDTVTSSSESSVKLKNGDSTTSLESNFWQNTKLIDEFSLCPFTAAGVGNSKHLCSR